MANPNAMTDEEEKVYYKLLRDEGVKQDQMFVDEFEDYVRRAKKVVADMAANNEALRRNERLKIAQEAGVTAEKTLARIRELVKSDSVQVELSGAETEVNELLILLSSN